MKIEITRMMTMIAACCFSSVLVLLTAETTFFAESLWAPPKIKNVQKLDPMVITPRSRVWNPFGITNNAKHINQSHLT
jgi:hypothetical protein